MDTRIPIQRYTKNTIKRARSHHCLRLELPVPPWVRLRRDSKRRSWSSSQYLRLQSCKSTTSALKSSAACWCWLSSYPVPESCHGVQASPWPFDLAASGASWSSLSSRQEPLTRRRHLPLPSLAPPTYVISLVNNTVFLFFYKVFNLNYWLLLLLINLNYSYYY